MVIIEDYTTPSNEAAARLLEGQSPIYALDTERRDLFDLCDGLEAYGCQVYMLSPDMDMNLLGAHVFAVVLGPGIPLLRAGELCREIRRFTDVPIVAFVRAPHDEHLSLLLDAGADHCFTGPGKGAARLVLSAVEATRRREQRATGPREDLIEAGGLCVDLETRTATLDGSPVPLTVTEFSILTLLAEHAGQLLSPVEILKHIHGQEYDPTEARDIVKVHVSRLRQKLDADPVAARCIVNVRGQGYRYVFDRRGVAQEQSIRQLAVS